MSRRERFVPNLALVAVLAALLSASALAADKSEILDFEADVIEGQKKTPEVFFQMEVEKPSLDAVLYQRRDFNDFHKVDSKQRPRQADPPRAGGARAGGPRTEGPRK